MNSAVERLICLRVKEVMHSEVLTLDESASMAAAAKQLSAMDVSGAPVVDAHGRCVGVLSATDFILKDADAFRREVVVHDDPDAPYQIETLNDQLVGAHMTPFVQTVSGETPILQAGRMMCREHIHRLIVVDEEQRPIGVVSSLDLVAATIAAVEE